MAATSAAASSLTAAVAVARSRLAAAAAGQQQFATTRWSISGSGSSFSSTAASRSLSCWVGGGAAAAAVWCSSGSNNHGRNNKNEEAAAPPPSSASSCYYSPLSSLPWFRQMTTTTTHCEQAAAASPPGNSTTSSRIQRKMTAIGHFSVASETVLNPSIITFVMNLQSSGDAPPLTRRDFLELWREKQIAARHPRFHQRVTTTSKSGRRLEFAEESQDTTIDSHVSETSFPANRHDLRRRLQQLQLDRWDLSQSLWHVWIASRSQSPALWRLPSKYDDNETATTTTNINANKNKNKNQNQTVLLFRGHHALADGASMGAALTDLFDESFVLRDKTVQFLEQRKQRQRRRRSKLSVWQRYWRRLQRLLQFLLGAIQALLHQSWLYVHQWWWWLNSNADPWRQVRREYFLANDSDHNNNKAKEEAETPAPRTLAWSDVAAVEQVKWVADTLSGRNNSAGASSKNSNNNNNKAITINDIFVSCVTAALAKQLQHHRRRRQALSDAVDDADANVSTQQQQPLPRQRHVHVAIPVHLKGGVVLPDESVGNNIGAFVIRVPGEMDDSDSNNNSDPSVARLRAVSRELHAIKKTPAALLSHWLAKGLSHASAHRLLPVSWTSKLYAASNAGSLAVISNNRGAPLPVHVKGRRVESLYGFVPLPPGVPVGVTVMSYAGHLNCTVAAEPWAVPDGDQFLVWVMEEYLQLAEAAKQRANAANE